MVNPNYEHPEKIIELVCAAAGVDPVKVLNVDRYHRHVMARAIISHILYSYGYTKDFIGKLFNRDHTTIWHMLNTIDHDIKHSDNYVIVWEGVKHLYEHDEMKRAYNLKKMRLPGSGKTMNFLKPANKKPLVISV